jgi:hypothetical protein
MKTIALIYRYRGRGRWVRISEELFRRFEAGADRIAPESRNKIKLVQLLVKVAPPRTQEVTQIDYFMEPVHTSGRLDKRRQRKILFEVMMGYVHDLSAISSTLETCISRRRAYREWRWKPSHTALEVLRSELAQQGLLL